MYIKLKTETNFSQLQVCRNLRMQNAQNENDTILTFYYLNTTHDRISFKFLQTWIAKFAPTFLTASKTSKECQSFATFNKRDKAAFRKITETMLPIFRPINNISLLHSRGADESDKPERDQILLKLWLDTQVDVCQSYVTRIIAKYLQTAEHLAEAWKLYEGNTTHLRHFFYNKVMRMTFFLYSGICLK